MTPNGTAAAAAAVVAASPRALTSEMCVKCAICSKKSQLTGCKQCVRCYQFSCKACFKIEMKVRGGKGRST